MPMQGDELAPGGKNILARRAWFDTPHRPGRDCELNPLKNLRKSARFEVSPHFVGLFGGLGAVVMVVGKGRDNPGAQFVGLGVAQFQRRHLFQMLVQQPGVNTPRGAKRRPDSLPKLPAAARYPPLP